MQRRKAAADDHSNTRALHIRLLAADHGLQLIHHRPVRLLPALLIRAMRAPQRAVGDIQGIAPLGPERNRGARSRRQKLQGALVSPDALLVMDPYRGSGAEQRD